MHAHERTLRALSLVAALPFVAALALVAPAAGRAASPTAEPASGRLVVSLASPSNAAGFLASTRGLGLTAKRGGAPGAVVLDTRGPGDETAIRVLAGWNGASRIERAQRVTAFLTPTDPRYPEQWGLPAISAPAAWDSTTGTMGVTVAVVDTGVQLDHPDLVARVDTVNDYDFVNLDSDASDDEGHGTHVAGIAAATMNNGAGGSGTAPGVAVLPIKVLDSKGTGWDSDVADGIRWAADHGADVINLSLGSSAPSTYEEDAVAYAQSAGCLVVAATGNDGGAVLSYPANYPGVIGVAAVDATLQRAWFSNYGPHADISAPGVNILSTYLTSPPERGYKTLSGTSMATPFVAGVAALLKSADPDATPALITSALQSTAIDLGAPGRDDYYGFGLVDAHAGLARLIDITPPVTTASGIPTGW
ncbi:MAG TPA: S8 family peptidase, partial [Coriobacteriia bacterium]